MERGLSCFRSLIKHSSFWHPAAYAGLDVQRDGPSTYHESDTMWGKWIKWITLITQQAVARNPNHPGISEVIMERPEGKDLGILPDEEVMHAEESPLYNKLRMRSNMPCSLTGPVILGVKGDRRMYILLLNKLQRLRKKQAYQWDCFHSRSCMHLVRNAEEWISSICTSRQFEIS